jgi:hypothetical protein
VLAAGQGDEAARQLEQQALGLKLAWSASALSKK